MFMSKPLILIVDDETHILHVVSLKLRNAGYDVVTSEDGEEGLAAALEQGPDLVITDHQMPFMTGVELCQKLKENQATSNTPALMLTARGFSMPEELLGQTNIMEVFSKPFSPKEILETVQRLLDQRKADQPANERCETIDVSN